MKKYVVYVRTRDVIYNIPDLMQRETPLTEDQLRVVVEAFDQGKISFYFAGRNYWLKNLHELKIFEHDKEFFDRMNEKIGQKGDRTYYNLKTLMFYGRDVSYDFLENREYICREEKTIKDEYVDAKRIEQLKSVHSSGFKLSKLIRLCEELNEARGGDCNFSVGMIVRAIVDHVAPVFGKLNFKEVANQYGDAGKSFKKSMKILDTTSRNIADDYLHSQISTRESLPTKTQVDFKQNLDLLLGHVYDLTK